MEARPYVIAGLIFMIKNIFLDAGYTLVYPKSFDWLYPVNFFDFCDKELFLKIAESDKYKKLYAKGYKYLDDNHLLKDENDEYDVFCEFYKIILIPFPELKFDREKIKTAAKSWVFNYCREDLYADVKDMLEKWKSEGYKLGIISDNFPSIVSIFKHYGIYGYFDVFVKSCDYGVFKPHETMYLSALNPLNAKGEESVFVDDGTKNLDGAAKFNINPIQIARSNNNHAYLEEVKYPKFENLIEIDRYIKSL